MSKKKKEESLEEVDSYKEIIKRYGNVVNRGVKVLANKRNLKTLSVSPAMDLGLNGGLLEGTLVVISGPPKCGKTTSCLQVCVNAQQEGREVIYLDGEGRLQEYNLIGVEGLDLDKIQIIASEEDCPALSAEDSLNILEWMIKDPKNKGSVAVIDSSSSLVPRDELDREASSQIRASLPKLLSHWLKKNAQTIKNQKIILIVIRHLITNTSGYGKHKLYDSGEYLQYQADTLLDCKTTSPWEEGGEKIGLILEWDIAASSKGSSGKKCISYLRFGLGIDKTQEIITLGTEFGLIEKSGAWFYLSYLDGIVEDYKKEDYRSHGAAKLYEYLSENKDKFDILNEKVKEMLK